MGALSADFNSPIKNLRARQTYIAATSTVLYKGGLVQLNSSGLAIAAIASSPLKIVGRAATSLDGTEAAGSTVTVEEGDIFLNLAGSGIPAQANVGLQVYAATDNEITTTAGTNSIAGIMVALATGPLGTSGAYVRCTLEGTQS